MLKKGISLDYLEVQILNRKPQIQNNTKFSFNRRFHRLSAFTLTIWNDTSFLSLCKICMRLETRALASLPLYPVTRFISIRFTYVAAHPQKKK